MGSSTYLDSRASTRAFAALFVVAFSSRWWVRTLWSSTGSAGGSAFTLSVAFVSTGSGSCTGVSSWCATFGSVLSATFTATTCTTIAGRAADFNFAAVLQLVLTIHDHGLTDRKSITDDSRVPLRECNCHIAQLNRCVIRLQYIDECGLWSALDCDRRHHDGVF